MASAFLENSILTAELTHNATIASSWGSAPNIRARHRTKQRPPTVDSMSPQIAPRIAELRGWRTRMRDRGGGGEHRDFGGICAEHPPTESGTGEARDEIVLKAGGSLLGVFPRRRDGSGGRACQGQPSHVAIGGEVRNDYTIVSLTPGDYTCLQRFDYALQCK